MSGGKNPPRPTTAVASGVKCSSNIHPGSASPSRPIWMAYSTLVMPVELAPSSRA